MAIKITAPAATHRAHLDFAFKATWQMVCRTSSSWTASTEAQKGVTRPFPPVLQAGIFAVIALALWSFASTSLASSVLREISYRRTDLTHVDVTRYLLGNYRT